jgi:predicted membrane protein
LIWPLLLIAAGILLLGQHVRRTHTDPDKDDRTGDSDRLHAFWFLGGGTLRVDSKKFRGGDVASFLSGGKIDLRNADFQNEAVVDVLSFLGKIEIIVPDGWEVSIQGTSLLGNMKNKTGEAVTIRPRQKPAESKRLVVKGLAFLGDVEVSNG